MSRADVVSPSSLRPVEPRWKTLLAVLLVLATSIWVTGLIDSLSRPSVAPVLTLQQQELSVLAEPAVPSALRRCVTGMPQDRFCLRPCRTVPKNRRSARQTQLLKLLQGPDDADIAAARASQDPLLQLAGLRCRDSSAAEALCLDQPIASGAALRLTLSAVLPLVMVLLGSLLLIQQGWSLLRGHQEPSPAVEGPQLTLVDMILLVAGGFVVISAVAMPLLALPLVGSLTSALVSPRREAVGVVINYSLMALPSLLILRRQLRSLDPQRCPSGGWLQWGWKPLPRLLFVCCRMVDGHSGGDVGRLAGGEAGRGSRRQQPAGTCSGQP